MSYALILTDIYVVGLKDIMNFERQERKRGIESQRIDSDFHAEGGRFLRTPGTIKFMALPSSKGETITCIISASR